ncbi:MAG: HEAT repeat domain-containing protein [Acidobacteriota bacterium]|nr:HEAT repeat domain-containing protein [Acidobacteriota bacterium]
MSLPLSASVCFLVLLTETVAAQSFPVSDRELATAINQLGDFDYDVRIRASRLIRRTSSEQAQRLLATTIAGHDDGYVRFRALVLLMGFGEDAAADVVHGVISDPNDRLRAVAYSYMEHNPDPAMIGQLLAALETETSEFVRPALIRALASHGSDLAVRTRLVADIDRGVDFFRGVVIEALGDREAHYAVGPLMRVAGESGPLQDDALLALARIGDRRILPLLADLQGRNAELEQLVSGAASALGVDRQAHMRFLAESLRFAVVAGDEPDLVSSAAAGLGAVASMGDTDAIDTLFDVGMGASNAAREQIALVLATLAMRKPSTFLPYLETRVDLETALLVIRDGFDMLDEDFEEERFFMAARTFFWANPEGSLGRDVAGTLIKVLEF